MIQDNRKFEGYLPFGDYTIGENSFAVSQGDSDVVVVVKPAGSGDAVAKAEDSNSSQVPSTI